MKGRSRTDNAAREEAARTMAIAALSYLAQDRDRLSRFLELTGLGPASIRTAASSPGFLAGVLEYVTGDEALLVAFADQAGVAPDDVEVARSVLAGRRWAREVP